jgi:hypothetical protein
MNRRQVRLALWAIFGLGLCLRILALRFEPPHHPDEFFQYLEPAWHRLTGVGVETWEWREGVRSWVLPGYHGAWMALLMRLGVRDGIVLATLLRAHWALLSLTLVWAGWRGGMLLSRRLAAAPASPEGESDLTTPPLGWQGGLLGALLCATFPLLVRFSLHTLSEPASMLCVVFALVLAGEVADGTLPRPRTRAVWSGVLLGLGICLRIQHAPVAVMIALWLLLARRFRLLLIVVGCALLPVALFAAVDWVTWGKPLVSYIGYVKFNYVENGANLFGKLPVGWYGKVFLQRLPVGIGVVGILCLLGLRAGWPFVASAVGLVLLLSTQPHKEERFVMLVCPLLLIPAAGRIGAWLVAARAAPPAATADGQDAPVRPSRRRVWLARAVAVVFTVLVLTDGALHYRGMDFEGLAPQRFEAQAWVGRQRDVTGLIYDEPLFVGGYLWFGRPFPQLMWNWTLLHNPLFNYVLVGRGTEEMRAAQHAGFVTVYAAGDFVVLRRERELP